MTSRVLKSNCWRTTDDGQKVITIAHPELLLVTITHFCKIDTWSDFWVWHYLSFHGVSHFFLLPYFIATASAYLPESGLHLWKLRQTSDPENLTVCWFSQCWSLWSGFVANHVGYWDACIDKVWGLTSMEVKIGVLNVWPAPRVNSSLIKFRVGRCLTVPLHKILTKLELLTTFFTYTIYNIYNYNTIQTTIQSTIPGKSRWHGWGLKLGILLD